MKNLCRPRLIGRLGGLKPSHLAVLLLVWIIACKDGGTPACTPITIPDPVACAGAVAPRWAISGFSSDRADVGAERAGVTVRMDLGESVRLSVRRASDAGDGCEATVESVAWSLSNPGAASLTPLGQEAWITGVAVGETAVAASIVFKDSPSAGGGPPLYVSELAASPTWLVRVVPAAAPSNGAMRIAHGSLGLAATPRAEGLVGHDSVRDFGGGPSGRHRRLDEPGQRRRRGRGRAMPGCVHHHRPHLDRADQAPASRPVAASPSALHREDRQYGPRARVRELRGVAHSRRMR